MYILQHQNGQYVTVSNPGEKHCYSSEKSFAMPFSRYVDAFNNRQLGERIIEL